MPQNKKFWKKFLLAFGAILLIVLAVLCAALGLLALLAHLFGPNVPGFLALGLLIVMVVLFAYGWAK
jgi:hypothetical protein